MKKIIILVICMSQWAYATTNLKLEEDQGNLQFLAVGNPGFLKINGKGKGPVGQLIIENQKIQGTLEVHLKDLETGLELRNKHMKEKYLEIEKFPNAKLYFKDETLPEGWSLANPKVEDKKINIELEIHGEKRPVEVTFSIDEKRKLKAQFEIKITDFKVEIPSFMGVTVTDRVNVEVQSALIENSTVGKR